MTKILPEKNLAIDHEHSQKETLIFEIDKTDANEKYEIQAFKKNRSSGSRVKSDLIRYFRLRRTLVIIGYSLSFGLFWLFLRWNKKLHMRLNYGRCSIVDSDVLGITNIKYNQFYKANVEFIPRSLGQFLRFLELVCIGIGAVAF